MLLSTLKNKLEEKAIPYFINLLNELEIEQVSIYLDKDYNKAIYFTNKSEISYAEQGLLDYARVIAMGGQVPNRNYINIKMKSSKDLLRLLGDKKLLICFSDKLMNDIKSLEDDYNKISNQIDVINKFQLKYTRKLLTEKVSKNQQKM